MTNQTFNLEQYEGERKVATIVYNVTYQLCRGLKKRHESFKQVPKTYFKIVKNK